MVKNFQFYNFVVLVISVVSSLPPDTTTKMNQHSKNRTNFVVMFMDDMGWGDPGCYGNPARETPHLDELARQGMLFTDFYSASPICSPSRASLMTGRLPVRNGFYSTNQVARNSYTPQEIIGGIPKSEVLISEILHQAGYRNKIIGKWHLGQLPEHLPLQRGFDEWFGAPNCHYENNGVTVPNIPVYRNDKMLGRYYEDFKINKVTGISNLTELYIQEAEDFLDQQAHKGQPFLLYWTPDATHTPLYASKKFRGQSQRGLYGDAVMELDSGVGRIMKKLRDTGLDQNTFVIFSSDNGAATYAFTEGGSTGPFLCGKQTTFEGGMREPAIAWMPSLIKPNQISHQVASTMDIYTTILDIAGLPHPKGVVFDGESLLPTLRLNKKRDRPIFYYRGDTLFKIRYGDYKAHFYTWKTPKEAQAIGYHYCPGEQVEGVTTEEMTNRTRRPLLFHLGRDPGEKFIIPEASAEYGRVMPSLISLADRHLSGMQRALPQLNWCDLAAQNWAPAGCEKVGRCQKGPVSKPFLCDWPY